MIWLVAVVIVLAVATAFSFAHAGSSRLSEQEIKASNARVLKEYQRMTVHQPEKIVDYRNSRVDT